MLKSRYCSDFHLLGSESAISSTCIIMSLQNRLDELRDFFGRRGQRQVKLWRAVFMWLVAVRKTIMLLGHNLSFVFSPILMKQSLI